MSRLNRDGRWLSAGTYYIKIVAKGDDDPLPVVANIKWAVY